MARITFQSFATALITFQSFATALITLFFLMVASSIWAQAPPATKTAIKITTGQAVFVVLPVQAIPSEETAAQELRHYLSQIAGAKLQVVRENQKIASTATVIYVGPTEFSKRHLKGTTALGAEEWVMQTQGKSLILTGGRPRGALYATYHFLEDVCGVRWWNPWEESVPRQKALSIPVLKERGQPSFRYRSIYMTYGNDEGRFAARTRQNSTPVTAAYGGMSEYNLPSAHSFYTYLPPEKYFKDHPDWYLVPGGGAPTALNSQLCVSNPEMRVEFLKVLRETIRGDRKKALAEKRLPPKLYDVSQMDNGVGFICKENKALVEKEGAESAALLDFVNYLADGIKDEFPDVVIDTLAYHSGEKAPMTMRARDNVMIVLTDTKSNLVVPITAERNRVMRENIEQWAKHCKHLRLWEYAITFVQPNIPTPTMHTYATDLQFLLRHNGEGLFIEFEEPLQTDMRDMKLWILAKMLENPHQDYNALAREFTDGFYGPAGVHIRRYLTTLETAAKESNANVDWFASTPQFKYLTLDFIRQSNQIYDQATATVKNNPVLSRRVRDARSSLDNIILQSYSDLTQQWVYTGHTPASMPLDRDAIADRYRRRWKEQIDLRLVEAERGAAHQKANAELDALIGSAVFVPLPAQFNNVPAQNLFMYNARAPRKDPSVKVVADAEALSGSALYYEIPEGELTRYKLPMEWGIYDDKLAKRIDAPTLIQATDIPAAGYHWYKMENAVLTKNAYLYFFWSWIIQSPMDDAFDPANPAAKFDVWISVKFSGPAFPHGKATDKNAISIERIVLVKK